jgi:fatty acid/phospholipid biosynthesis enzyme
MLAQFLWLKIQVQECVQGILTQDVILCDEFIKIIFVKSDENVADMFTKNIGKEIYESHMKNLFWKE